LFSDVFDISRGTGSKHDGLNYFLEENFLKFRKFLNTNFLDTIAPPIPP